MKRKQLSMKKLYQYWVDWNGKVNEELKEKYKDDMLKFEKHLSKTLKRNQAVLLEFFDYIWKNPK